MSSSERSLQKMEFCAPIARTCFLMEIIYGCGSFRYYLTADSHYPEQVQSLEIPDLPLVGGTFESKAQQGDEEWIR